MIYQGAIILALGLDLVLGLAIFVPNPRRVVNLLFFLLSILIAVWLGTNIGILATGDPVWAARHIRAAGAVAAFTPVLCQMLRMASADPHIGVGGLLRRSWPMLALGLLVGAACFTPWHVREVRMPAGGSPDVVEPVYGPFFPVYVVYFLAQVVGIFVFGAKTRRTLEGTRRVELDYVLFGAIAALSTGGLLGMGFTLATGTSRLMPVTNALSIGLLTSIVGYGIATRRIMGVAEMLRRAVGYALLCIALSVLYFGVVTATGLLIGSMEGGAGLGAYLAGAVAVAVSVEPFRRRLLALSARWMGDEDVNEVSGMLDQAVRDLLAVRTVEELAREFVEKAGAIIGAERALLLLRADGHFEQVQPVDPSGGLRLSAGDPLPRLIASSSNPLPLYVLERTRPTTETTEAVGRMEKIGAQMVAGIFSSDRLEGLLILGRRRRGAVYSPREQERIRHLCGQFSLSLSNARLYTEVQDARRYDATLLDSLSSGVIACDARHNVTVLNREAGRLLGVNPSVVVGDGLDRLPEAVARPLAETMETGHARRDFDVPFASAGTRIVLRGSSSVVTGHRGRSLGALLVFNDVTALVDMEARMRRSDRLASVGTLAAGMAHEIKNPLVTLNTFAHLLPRSFDDPDFRTTFAPLVESEVQRINAVVNQLLNFARPAEPSLAPVHLHEVLDRTLQLVEIQCRNRDLKMERSFQARTDLVEADKSLLEQVFVNLYFNAMDAMQAGGRLGVETEVVEVPSGERDLWGVPLMALRLRVTVRDTGHGIPEEHLPHIFDPFYTTKANGWGLGLSITHGIVKQHGGAVDVESVPGRGTAFSVLLPLCLKREDGP